MCVFKRLMLIRGQRNDEIGLLHCHRGLRGIVGVEFRFCSEQDIRLERFFQHLTRVKSRHGCCRRKVTADTVCRLTKEAKFRAEQVRKFLHQPMQLRGRSVVLRHIAKP